ncbi:hypothetical protein [Sphingomonas sp. 8AM]|uniref:hypothetical protein n=1 Tax=Sphingomonas sp. 8AM TaxID=2653170 RepID=UPI0012F0CE4F|nr:hypothetical protein [Sphingomonas sp. 8AM]VXC79829.1 conserved hypothetical protein [Sphingomonas sp. 8AM]
MSIHYSPSRNSFFDDRVHATLPDDAHLVTAEEHARLLDAQTAGKVITPGLDGEPTARRPAENGEQLRARLITATKREAAHRIEAIAPLWRQLNDWRDLPLSQGSERAAIEARVAAINAIREASNDLEQKLAAMTARQLAKADIANDTHWTQGAAA